MVAHGVIALAGWHGMLFSWQLCFSMQPCNGQLQIYSTRVISAFASSPALSKRLGRRVWAFLMVVEFEVGLDPSGMVSLTWGCLTTSALVPLALVLSALVLTCRPCDQWFSASSV